MKRNLATPEPPPIYEYAPAVEAAEPGSVHACKILIIDDEEPNVRLLERLLTHAGYRNFLSTTNSDKAAELFSQFQPDLVLTDWLMPVVDGLGVIEQIRTQTAAHDYLPIVVLTADVTSQTRRRALEAGATDFLTKPIERTEVLLRIRNLLTARRSHLIVHTHNATLEESVRRRTIELERALTELRRTQQQVIEQERLAALGAMAAGIAHDFNNALSIIMGFSEALLCDLEQGLTRENAAEPLTAVFTAAEDAAKIVHRLSEFYRPVKSMEPREPVNFEQLIEQAIMLTRPRWRARTANGGRIAVTAEPGAVACVLGDAAELREVLTNLIFNAVDAMPEGGAIVLKTHVEGATAVLQLSDTGIGMSEEVRRRCLEPFFTTKGERGTGLGLSVTFGIIHRHRGTIDVASEQGSGTTFTIRLPLADAAPMATADE